MWSGVLAQRSQHDNDDDEEKKEKIKKNSQRMNKI